MPAVNDFGECTVSAAHGAIADDQWVCWSSSAGVTYPVFTGNKSISKMPD
jgi:hypothetical protein